MFNLTNNGMSASRPSNATRDGRSTPTNVQTGSVHNIYAVRALLGYDSPSVLIRAVNASLVSSRSARTKWHTPAGGGLCPTTSTNPTALYLHCNTRMGEVKRDDNSCVDKTKAQRLDFSTSYHHACMTVGRRQAHAPMGAVNDVLGSPQTRFAPFFLFVAIRSAILPHQIEILARRGDSNNRRSTVHANTRHAARKGIVARLDNRVLNLGWFHCGTVVHDYWHRQILN